MGCILIFKPVYDMFTLAKKKKSFMTTENYTFEKSFRIIECVYGKQVLMLYQQTFIRLTPEYFHNLCFLFFGCE